VIIIALIFIFCTIIGLLVAGISIIVSGAIIISISIFALISYKTPLTKDILFSLLFIGIGTTILGGLFTNLFEKITKIFFKLTKKYVKLNMRLVKR